MYRPYRVIKSCSVEISVWIYKNDAIELPLCSALSGRFFLARDSKGDDIKIKRKVSAFFPPLPVYLAFIAILSLCFARLHG